MSEVEIEVFTNSQTGMVRIEVSHNYGAASGPVTMIKELPQNEALDLAESITDAAKSLVR